jgi:hypothetical protein
LKEREGNRRSAAYTFFLCKFSKKGGSQRNENMKPPGLIIVKAEARIVAKSSVGDNL